MHQSEIDYPSLIGKEFFNLKVLGIGYVKRNQRQIICQCKCGAIVEIAYYHLTHKRDKDLRQSCKNCVYSNISGKKSKKYKGCEEVSGKLLGSIRRGAKSRNLEFNITAKYIWDIFLQQNRKCALSGIEITFGKSIKNKKDGTASLDRIDSSKGYIEGNVQWVHKDINLMKWDLNQNDFIEYCKLIAKNNL